MVVNINGTYINIDSSFSSFMARFRDFEVNNYSGSNYVYVDENNIQIHINDYRLDLKCGVNTTDLYPIANNIISYCINDNKNLYIHSVVISKGGEGILLLGDFGCGKTSLARVACEYGYEINSADQTWIDGSTMVKGSSMSVFDGAVEFLDKSITNKKVSINMIVILKGICDNGDLLIKKITNRNHYIKNIFNYCNWHYNMPLLSNYVKLKDTGIQILEFLKKYKVDAYVVRGDKYKIMEAIYDRKKGFE